MRLPMLLLMAIGTMSAFAQNGKQEKPPVEPAITFSNTITIPQPVATISATTGMQVYTADGGLIAKCDSTGEWPHEVVSNCIISEGHTLSEVMQVWLNTNASNSDAWNQDRKDQERRYEELWQAFHDYVKQNEKDLKAIQDALHGITRRKPSPTK